MVRGLPLPTLEESLKYDMVICMNSFLFIKNKEYTVSTDRNTSVNYKFYEICSEKHSQYKNTEYNLCPLYKENPLSLSITRIFVNNNIKDRDKQIDQIITKFSYLIKHQINIGKIEK